MPIGIHMCLLMHKCWRQTLIYKPSITCAGTIPSDTNFVHSKPYTLGIIYAGDKPHTRLIYVDQVLFMLVTNLT